MTRIIFYCFNGNIFYQFIIWIFINDRKVGTISRLINGKCVRYLFYHFFTKYRLIMEYEVIFEKWYYVVHIYIIQFIHFNDET